MLKHLKASEFSELKCFLDEQTDCYNRKSFITDDPISIPHRYSKKEDIEISGFLAATIAWGQRPVILNNAIKLLGIMNDEPHEFITNAGKKDFVRFNNFVHRTFNGVDAVYFIRALQNCYLNPGGLEQLFTDAFNRSNGIMSHAISLARDEFFSFDEPGRTSKHFSDPLKNASAKRINMFLRWMVRNDKRGVDFGIWKTIKPSDLYCPLDVHSGTIARELGILKRNQNDWKAVEELTINLRLLDKNDPVKYDFALFGIGVNG